MEPIIKSLLKEISITIPKKDKCFDVLQTIMNNLVYSGAIEYFDIRESGIWAFEVTWVNLNAIKHWSFCMNIDWCPIYGIDIE